MINGKPLKTPSQEQIESAQQFVHAGAAQRNRINMTYDSNGQPHALPPLSSSEQQWVVSLADGLTKQEPQLGVKRMEELFQSYPNNQQFWNRLGQELNQLTAGNATVFYNKEAGDKVGSLVVGTSDSKAIVISGEKGQKSQLYETHWDNGKTSLVTQLDSDKMNAAQIFRNMQNSIATDMADKVGYGQRLVYEKDMATTGRGDPKGSPAKAGAEYWGSQYRR